MQPNGRSIGSYHRDIHTELKSIGVLHPHQWLLDFLEYAVVHLAVGAVWSATSLDYWWFINSDLIKNHYALALLHESERRCGSGEVVSFSCEEKESHVPPPHLGGV